MTSYTNASSQTSNDNSKENMQRNKKTQALSALLSATALGVFLEGCGGGDTPASTPALVEGSESNPFVATVAADIFDGSEGKDWVSYAETASGVEVNLSHDPASVGEGATGDRLTGIRNLIGSEYDDIFTGNVQANSLRGGAGNDRIYGGGGEDTLDGGKGDENILNGGTGADTYIFRVGDGTDIINDVVESTGTSIINLRFEGSQYEADDFIENRADGARFSREEGGNALVISIDKDDSDEITDQVTINNAYDTNDNLRYTINVAYGSEGSFTEIEAAATYWNSVGSENRPFLATAGDDPFTGKTGADWVSYANAGATEGATITLNDDADTAAEVGGAATGDTLLGIQNLIGTAQGDTLTGNGQANTLRGGDGLDTINGGVGNDIIEGGADGDILNGDAGMDTIDGGAGGDTLNGGAGNDALYGGADGDTLEGGAGVDTLDGGGGTDTYIFASGHGADTIAIDADGDKLLFKAAASFEAFSFGRTDNDNVKITVGSDSVEFLPAADASGRYTLHHGADDVTLSGLIFGAGETLTGGDGRDVIIGAAQAETINGGAGDDTLYGEAGGDTINGGAGDDIILGGAGADTYIFRVGDGADTITDGEGDTINLRFIGAYEATDFAATSNNFNKVGNNLEITIDKNTDDNILDQVTINDAYNSEGELRFTIDVEYGVDLSNLDAVLGSESNPFLATNAADTFTGLAAIGADWVSYAYEGFTPFTVTHGFPAVTEAVGVYFEILESGYPADARWGAAGDSLTDINNLIGTEYKDNFVGNSADNIFHGNGGDDTLQGAMGDDALYGGAGNDTLFGLRENDIIDGGAGADTLHGGRGIDTFIFRVGDGTDTIYDWVSSTATENIINLQFLNSDLGDYEDTDFKSDDNNPALFTKDERDLVISINSDQVTINNAFNRGGELSHTINVAYGTEGSLTEVTADYWNDLGN